MIAKDRVFCLDAFSQFFEKFKMLQNAEQTDINHLLNEPHHLKQFFNDFARQIKDKAQAANDLNIFDICLRGREEMRNCEMLAWLLDENGSHGLGNSFLKGIISFCDATSIEDAQFSGYATRTEYCPNSDNANRVDIVCDGNEFLLYVEVKIDSFEHANQTERYYEKLSVNLGSRMGKLIFISPSTLPACEKATFISWNNCADVLAALSADRMKTGMSNVAWLIRQYADFIRKF